MNLGTIGHIDHGKPALTAMITRYAQEHGTPAPDAGMPPEPKRYVVAMDQGKPGMLSVQPTEFPKNKRYVTYADYALLKSYIQRQGKGEL